MDIWLFFLVPKKHVQQSSSISHRNIKPKRPFSNMSFWISSHTNYSPSVSIGLERLTKFISICIYWSWEVNKVHLSGEIKEIVAAHFLLLLLEHIFILIYSLTLPAPIPDKKKTLTQIFILIQLFEMNGTGRANLNRFSFTLFRL